MDILRALRRHLAEVAFAGVSAGIGVFEQERARLLRQLSILSFKWENAVRLPPVLVFEGGTGTGKSSIFNSLIGYPVSRTGVQRPQTVNPLVFLPEELNSLFLESDLFPTLKSEWRDVVDSVPSEPDTADTIVFVKHRFSAWQGSILVDSPDMDSVVASNRASAEDLFNLSDLVVFVTSQEKYADKLPFSWLEDARRTGKPFLLVLNKWDSEESRRDLTEKLDDAGIRPSGDVIGLPRVRRDEPTLFHGSEIAPLLRLIESMDRESLMQRGKLSLVRACLARLDLITELLRQEKDAQGTIFSDLAELATRTEERLFSALAPDVDERTRSNMKKQLRLLLARYDYFRHPRKWVRDLVLAPLDFLGVMRKKGEPEQESSVLVKHRLPMEPLKHSLAFFQEGTASILRAKAPGSNLYALMLGGKVFLSPEEIEAFCLQELGFIDGWIQERFERLKKGLSTGKKVGVASASVLSGLMLLLVETVVGGGITILELLLDTAVIPYIPKGVLELVVYDEIKSIGRELDTRYRATYENLLNVQKQQVADFLSAHFSRDSDLELFGTARDWLQRTVNGFPGNGET
jgi:hypothetical protein